MSKVEVTDEMFEFDEAFDLCEFASRSFGVFQEEPFDVTLRFDANVASDAEAFLFHPGQETTVNADGSLTVCFRASGSLELCRHLFTWDQSVTVERPESLRRELAHMCATLAEHHGAGQSVMSAR